MKILVVGDPHTKLSSIREIDLLARRIVEKCKELSILHIVILGDLADGHAKMHVQVFNAIIKFFEVLLEAGLRIYYPIGNHDAINNQIFLSEDHFFNAFKWWQVEGDLKIIDDVEDTHIGPHRFVFCPYVPPGRFREALTKEPRTWDGVRAIFCHQEFKGAKMGAIESKHGDEWPETAPLIISGHIHDREKLQKNIFYVGTPYPAKFGEKTEKTVTVLDVADDGKISMGHIDLGLPKKLTVKITTEQFKSYQLPENTHVRMHLSGTVEEIAKCKKTKKYQELKDRVKIIPKPIDKAEVKHNVERKDYMELLGSAVSAESKVVQDIYEEVMRDEA
jgi:DNA repair exonuclease SbcCD nuclease subunit